VGGGGELNGATLTTSFAGANNDLLFTQISPGTAPTIRFSMGFSGANTVTVTGREIHVYLGRNFGSFYLSADGIKSLIETSAPALALVTVAIAQGNSGAGAVCQPDTADISFGPTAMSGGSSIASPPSIFDSI
jgi:hypothetical protein